MQKEQTTTQQTLIMANKLLPKSYQKYGAYVAQVSLDEKQSKEVANGDEGTLEELGPIEWVTSTESPNVTLSSEIRFIINQQNINQMTRNNRKNKAINEKQKKQRAERPRKLVNAYTDPPLNQFVIRTTVDPNQKQIPFEAKQRRVSYRQRKPPGNRRRRIKVHKFIRIQNSTDHNLKPAINHRVSGNAREPMTRKRVHRIFGKENNRAHTQRHGSAEKIARNHDFPVQKGNLEDKSVPLRSGLTTVESKTVSDSELDWKRATKPKLLMVAKMKDLNHLKVDTLTGIKWWNQEQPSYCSEPIYVLNDCSERRFTKRWSYNPSNKKCYLYEDYCSQFKANSFETSHDCFRKCYRAKE